MASHHTCKICDKAFARAFTLRRHLISMHPSVPPPPRSYTRSYKCGICNMDNSSFPEFVSHINENHDILLESEEFEFNCYEDFAVWKKSVEKKSLFVKYRNDEIIQGSNATKSYFRCNRCGSFKDRILPTERKRHLRLGSSKIGSFCPARILATTNVVSGKISVKFTKTHVGHDLELAHIPLPVEDKMQLASKIAQNIPFDTIINDLKASAGDEIERKHLVTKQYLRNIASEVKKSKVNNEEKLEKIKRDIRNCVDDIMNKYSDNKEYMDSLLNYLRKWDPKCKKRDACTAFPEKENRSVREKIDHQRKFPLKKIIVRRSDLEKPNNEEIQNILHTAISENPGIKVYKV